MRTGSGNIKRNKLFAMKDKSFLSFFLLFILFLISGCGEKPSLTHFNGSTMGTWYTIKYSISAEESGIPESHEIHSAVDSVLNQVNLRMSTYIKDSEISRFNQFKDTSWFAVSKDFASVVSIGLHISQETGGAFDVTVGPLVNLWGFGPTGEAKNIPSDEIIDIMKRKVGYNKLSVRVDPPALKKSNPDLYCDLSAIAKGFGVDKISELLIKLGIENFMAEIGGEVRTAGLNNKLPWRIGISTPDEKQGIQAVVNLNSDCIATSGDYHSYFEKDGNRYSHTIDPLTGKPIIHNLASVSVVFPNCTGADAYATAINVMGPTQGMIFAKEKKLPVFMIVKEQQGFRELATEEFEKYMTKINKEL